MRKSTKAAKLAASVAANVPAIIETLPAVIDAAPVSETPALDTVNASDLVSGVTIDGATGETIDNAAPIEAKPDPRAERAARIAADRLAVRELYSAFEANRLSVPVKALSAFKLATSTAHPVTRGVSQRQCAALAVAFAAAGTKLKPGASAPRVFEIDGKPSAIENGVLRDAISSGLCTVAGETPEAEIITLSATAHKSIAGQLGASIIKAAKI